MYFFLVSMKKLKIAFTRSKAQSPSAQHRSSARKLAQLNPLSVANCNQFISNNDLNQDV